MALITKTLAELKSEKIAIDFTNFQLIDAINLQKEVNEFYPCEVKIKQDENGFLSYHSVDVILNNPTTETRIHKYTRGGKLHYSIYSSDISHNDHFKNISKWQKDDIIKEFVIPNNIGKLSTKKVKQWVDYTNLCFVAIEAENIKKTSEVENFLESIKDQNVKWYNNKKNGEIIKNGLIFSFTIDKGYISKKMEIYSKVNTNIDTFLQLADNNYKGV